MLLSESLGKERDPAKVTVCEIMRMPVVVARTAEDAQGLAEVVARAQDREHRTRR